MAELARRQSRPAVDRCRPGDRRRGARSIDAHIERDARARATPCTRLALPDTMRARHLRAADADRDRPHRRAEARGVRPGAARVRYRREDLDGAGRAVNATGYGLTLGVHTRIDETIARVTAAQRTPATSTSTATWSARSSACSRSAAKACRAPGRRPAARSTVLRLLSQRPPMSVAKGELPGPVGERNTYGERPKGTILCIARDPADRAAQQAAAKAMGNRVTDDPAAPHLVAALFAGSPEDLRALNQRLAAREGAIVPVYVAPLSRRVPGRRGLAQRQHRRRRRQRQPDDDRVVSSFPPQRSWGGARAADGGVMSNGRDAHDPSVGVDADTSPSMTMGRKRCVTDKRSSRAASICRSRRRRARGTASGVLARASLPMSRSRVWISGSATATFTASASLSAMSAGRPAGAARPSHDTTS